MDAPRWPVRACEQGSRWILRFDREAVEPVYYERFYRQQLQFGDRLTGQPVLCIGARLGGEVRALTRLGALAIGIDFNPGFRNTHVLWGDASSLQFANATFRHVYTNVGFPVMPGSACSRTNA